MADLSVYFFFCSENFILCRGDEFSRVPFLVPSLVHRLNSSIYRTRKSPPRGTATTLNVNFLLIYRMIGLYFSDGLMQFSFSMNINQEGGFTDITFARLLHIESYSKERSFMHTGFTLRCFANILQSTFQISITNLTKTKIKYLVLLKILSQS